MKTILRRETKVSLYVVDDACPVIVGEDVTVIGDPPELMVADCTQDNCVVVENVAVPNDWRGGKYTYDGAWTLSPQWVEPPPPAPEPVPVPSAVSMRQARLALLQAGKLADVDAAVAALPSPAKEAAQVEWEYATEVRRDSALMQQLATAIGLTEVDLDNLFVQAATL